MQRIRGPSAAIRAACRGTAAAAWRRTGAPARAAGARMHSSASTPQGGQFRGLSQDAATRPKREGDMYDKVAFIGAGMMAEAMVAPLIQAGLQSAKKISVYDVATSSMARLEERHGVCRSESIADCIDTADLIVYAVKPQNCGKVNEEITRARSMEGITIRDDATLLTIVAGEPISRFVHGTGFSKVARSMPNTPAMIGQGVTVWTCTPDVSSSERDKIKEVLGTFGTGIFVEDESFVDMSTSISGSGPAYIFMLMEAMVDAGVHMGFSRDVATTLVQHTILGSTLYAMKTGDHPAILRNSVTSPAGTTASAMYELENGKFRVVIKDAIWACYRRTLELGGYNSNVGPGRMAFTPPFESPIKIDPRSSISSPRVPSGELTAEDVEKGTKTRRS